MTDRFASLKSNTNTFKKVRPNKTSLPSLKTNSRFDSLSEKKQGNRFASKKRNIKRRYNNKNELNSNISPNIGKFTQVGTGEVSFTPQYKCGNKDKKKKKVEKLKEIKKGDINEIEINNDADIALTLALAEKYQYFTESEEEDEENYDHDPLTPNTELV